MNSRFFLLLGALGVQLSVLPAAAVAAATASTPAATPSVAQGDWRDRRALAAKSPKLLEGLAGYCEGRYVEPAFPLPLGTDDRTLPIQMNARELDYQIKGKAELSGDVVIQRGNRSLRTAAATVSEPERKVYFKQPVKVREPGFVMQGQQAEADLDSTRSSVRQADFLMYQNNFRGTAARIEQDEQGNLEFHNGRFTRCVPGNNNWSIASKDISIKKDAVFGTAHHAVIRIHKLPIFYTPYLKFPVTDERLSGWLTPEFGFSEENGTDISLPYYLNLAPNYDATLTPRLLSNRGPVLEGELRHLSAWSEVKIGAGFLYRDDLYNGEFSRSDFNELGLPGNFESANRWLVTVDQRGHLGHFRSRVDFGQTSDSDYFRDLGNNIGVVSRVELEQTAEVQYQLGGFSGRLWTQGFQNLQEDRLDPYRRLPELDLSYRGRLAGPLNWSLAGIWSDFQRDQSQLTGSNSITGLRLHLEPRLQLPLAWSFGFLTLTGAYRYTQYNLENLPAGFSKHPDRKLGMGSVDGGLFFERATHWGRKAVVQTLEPRIYYLYQTFEDQSELPRFDASVLNFSFSQLFRDNRFSGIDRIGDANQISTALTSRFLDADDGREFLSASIGFIYHFDDRKVTLSGLPTADDRHSTSALVADLSASPARFWQLRAHIIWDTHDNQVDESSYSLQYRRDNRHILNLGFRTRNESQDINQSDVSLYWPATRHWSFIGRWNYDLEFTRTIEGFAGLEYNDCCWQVRVMARRFIKNPANRIVENIKADNGIFLQLVFKGLAGFGKKIDSIMEKGIRGYRAETY